MAAAVVCIVRRWIRDFNIVRRGANREVSHVVSVKGTCYFRPSIELREFGSAYGRLPRWAQQLALHTAA